MTPEEFQKLKEAEKDHLRKIKELKKLHKEHARHASVTRAVTDMATGMKALYDEQEEMVDRLQMQTMRSEARMEVALDAVGSSELDQAQDAALLERDMEAIKKAKAQELVRQMKMEVGSGSLSHDSSATVSSQGAASSQDSAESETGSQSTQKRSRTPLNETPKPNATSDLPEKTIGRMKP